MRTKQDLIKAEEERLAQAKKSQKQFDDDYIREQIIIIGKRIEQYKKQANENH